jgi:hypothetical protein
MLVLHLELFASYTFMSSSVLLLVVGPIVLIS